MEQITLTIGGKEYPIRYTMAAIQRALKVMNVKPSELAAKAVSPDMSDIMDFSLSVAWAGLMSGHKLEHPGKPAPFAGPEELAEAIESLQELNPAIELFSAAWLKFVGAGEAQEGNEPGEVQTAPVN